jgi:hypothetical protein
MPPLRPFLAALLIVFLGTIPAWGQAPDPSTWRSDVGVLMDSLRQIQPAPYHAHGADAWEQAADRLRTRLPTLSYAEAFAGVARLVALADDGHTFPYLPQRPEGQALYPVTLRLFADGLYVSEAAAEHTTLFGQRVLRVNGVPVREVRERLRPLLGGNAMRHVDMMPLLLQAPVAVHGAGLSDSLRAPLVLTTAGPEGDATTTRIEAAPRRSASAMESAQGYRAEGGAQPLYQRLDGNYAFEHVPDDKLLYIRLRSVIEADDAPFPAFVRRAFAVADTQAVEKLVVDLRGNSGGNNYLVQPLLHALIRHEATNQAGRLFVITDRGTFSAAVNLAARIERHTHAMFVGEPPSARPNLYGDPESFTLPASGIRVAVSGLYWQESDPRDDRPWIRPDLPVRLSFDQYATGRDPALEAIRAFDPAEAPEALTAPPNQHWDRPGQDQGWTVVTNP